MQTFHVSATSQVMSPNPVDMLAVESFENVELTDVKTENDCCLYLKLIFIQHLFFWWGVGGGGGSGE